MQERESNYKAHAVQRFEFNLPIRRVESGGAEAIDVVTSNFDDGLDRRRKVSESCGEEGSPARGV